MNMQSTPDEPRDSSSEQPSGSLFRDWWDEIYPRDLINTIKGFFVNHKRFFDEVFSEQWEVKMKPIPFIFLSMTLVFLAGSLSPFGNPFDATPGWNEIVEQLSEDEEQQLITALKLEDAVQIDDASAKRAAIEKQLELVLKDANVTKQGPITAQHLQQYFENEATKNPTLAARAEYTVLKSEKANELGDLGFTFMLNFFLLYLVFYWAVSHRFLKCPDRTRRQTVYVYMYLTGMLLLFVYVPAIFLAEGETAWSFIPVVATLFIIYKSFSVFRHTHNAGPGRLIWAWIMTLFVTATLGVPLLFMSSKPAKTAVKA